MSLYPQLKILAEKYKDLNRQFKEAQSTNESLQQEIQCLTSSSSPAATTEDTPSTADKEVLERQVCIGGNELGGI